MSQMMEVQNQRGGEISLASIINQRECLISKDSRVCVCEINWLSPVSAFERGWAHHNTFWGSAVLCSHGRQGAKWPFCLPPPRRDWLEAHDVKQ